MTIAYQLKNKRIFGKSSDRILLSPEILTLLTQTETGYATSLIAQITIAIAEIAIANAKIRLHRGN
ncbi:MAG: hypothetical protein V7K50_05065 [Nostoc sp.]